MLPGMEDPPPPAPRPRARASSAPARTGPSTRRLILGSLAAALALFAALYAFHRVEQFLIRDTRFALNNPEDSADGDSLLLSGANHASHHAIEEVFAEDYGRSIYLIPLEQRRTTLQTIDWIRDAEIARLWPNRLVVRITERKPVAFITLPSGRISLIDEDGVILPQAQDRFNVPVLSGVHPSDALADRRERVGRMLRVMRELGDAGKEISEVDVSDRDNIKVSQPSEGRIVTLLLGDRHFLVRYQNFVNHFDEIRHKLPGASTLDLRLEDRITVVE